LTRGIDRIEKLLEEKTEIENSDNEEETIESLCLVSANEITKKRKNSKLTTHCTFSNNNENKNETIDFILVTPEIIVKQWGILNDTLTNNFNPSTHRPVVADLIIV
jgi:hypothetical protein